MNTAEPFIFAAMSGAMGGILLWQGLKTKKRIRQVEDTATAKLASAALGHTEVQGFAWPKNNWFDSRTNRRLVYYQMRLEKQVTEGSGKNRRTKWITIYSYSFNENFLVLDPTGLAEVQIAGSELNLSSSKTTYWGRFSQVEQNYYINKIIKGGVSGFPPSNFLFGLFSSKFRVVESEIVCGCPIYINGHLEHVPQDYPKIQSIGLSDFVKKVINTEARSLKNVNAILDKNSDGKISEKELHDGYVFAAQLSFLKARKENTTENDFEVHGVFKHNQDHPLFIADTHQDQLTKRLSRRAYLKLIFGFILVGVCIGLLLYMTGQKF